MTKEKRIAPRRDLQKAGTIADAEGIPICRCVMVNVSATGAKLVVEALDKVPDNFILVLSQNGAVQRKCDVRWRKGNAIGVRFALSPSFEAATISFINDTLARLMPDQADQEDKAELEGKVGQEQG